jgi:hypothetical protein
MFGKETSKGQHICGECSNFKRYRYHSKLYRKCTVYGVTNSEASDWAKKYEACGMFNQEYTGRPIIELVKHNSNSEPEPLLDGQIIFF